MDKNQKLQSSLGYYQYEITHLKGGFSFLVNSISKQREEIDDHTMKSSRILDLIMKKYHGESRAFFADNQEACQSLSCKALFLYSFSLLFHLQQICMLCHNGLFLVMIHQIYV